ncbi:MAG: PIN domain-containing protein [Myxococcota bacterium]
MRAIDTNVLIRYLVREPRGSAVAKQVLELVVRHRDSGRALLVPIPVVIEAMYVLTQHYDVPKADAILALEDCTRTLPFFFESEDVVRGALKDYRAGTADFADYMIRRVALASADELVSLDEKQLKAPRVVHPRNAR